MNSVGSFDIGDDVPADMAGGAARLADLLQPPGGWPDHDTARTALEGVPDTTAGERPETLDDLVEALLREHYDDDFARRGCRFVRRVWRQAFGIDARRLCGESFLGGCVPVLRSWIAGGMEKGRISTGALPRN
jgi:hypothetical protein